MALEITDPVVLVAADKEAGFLVWLLEKPDTRLPAWVAATENEEDQ